MQTIFQYLNLCFLPWSENTLIGSKVRTSLIPVNCDLTAVVLHLGALNQHFPPSPNKLQTSCVQTENNI